MSKGKDVKAGGGYVTLDIRNRLAKGLKAASAQLKAFGASMSATGAIAAGAGLAIVGPLLAAVGVFNSLGSQIADVSARTGVSAEAISELGFAAEDSGGSMEALEKGFVGLSNSTKKAQDGSTATVEAFDRLGVSVGELSAMNPEQRFYAVAEALSKVEDMSLRGALAQQVLGKSGRQLLPMLADGAKGLDAMREKARAAGLTIDGQAAASADEFGDKLAALWKQVKMVAFQVGAALVDDLIAFIDAAVPLVATLIAWIKENKTLIAMVFKVGAALLAVGGTLTALGLTFSLIGTAIGGLIPILGFLLTPVGAVIAILAVAGVAFFGFTKTGRAAIKSLVDTLAPFVEIFKKTMQGVFDAIAGGNFELAGKIAIAGLRVALVEGFAKLAAWFEGAFGDLLGTVVSQLAAGDMAGAWETIVLQMTSIWDSFAEGVVAVFTAAARYVVDAWQKAATQISNQILEMAASGGVVGTVMSKVLGVDVGAEAAKGEKLRLDQIAQLQRVAEEYRKLAAEADAAGDTKTAGRWKQNLADVESQLANLNAAPADFVGDSQRDAAAQLAGMGDGFREQLDQLDKAANERAMQSQRAIEERRAGGIAAAGDAAAKEQAELDALLKQAADQRKAVDEERRKAIDDGEFELPDLAEVAAATKSETQGTISGRAAALIGGQVRRPREEKKAAGIQAIAGDSKKIAKAAENGLAFG